MAAERVDYYSDEEFQEAQYSEIEEMEYWQAYEEERQRELEEHWKENFKT